MAATKNLLFIYIAVPLLIAAISIPSVAAEHSEMVKRAFPNPLNLLKAIAGPLNTALSVINTLIPVLQQALALVPN